MGQGASVGMIGGPGGLSRYDRWASEVVEVQQIADFYIPGLLVPPACVQRQS